MAVAMKAYASKLFTHALPARNKFPMERYYAVSSLLKQIADRKKIEILEPPNMATYEQVLRAHDKEFVDAYMNGSLSESENRKIGFPWSETFVKRTLTITGATISATQNVLDEEPDPISCVLAGGTHHAFRGHGEGYCIFNDIGVAALHALETYQHVKSILVLDLDVHQGNGTAEIFENDPRVYTFSMHADKNYPWSSRVNSDYDVGLPDETGDADYCTSLKESILQLVEDMSGKRQWPPDLVYYQAGVDPLREDRLGRLNLTRDGLKRRNDIVFSFLAEHDIPTVVTMGGGYSRPILDTAKAHCDVFIQAGDSCAERR